MILALVSLELLDTVIASSFSSIPAAVKLLDSGDLDEGGAGAADPGPAHVEEVGEVDDMRLAGCVVDRGLSRRRDRGEHDVDRRPDRGYVEIDRSAVKPSVRAEGMVAAVFDPDFGSQGLKSLDVLIDRAHSEIAASREADKRLSESPEQRSEKICRRSQSAYQR